MGLGADEDIREANEEFSREMWPVFVFMFLVMVVGAVGNTLVILVSLMKKGKRAASYYILTLAAIDLFTCMGLHPYILWRIINFYDQRYTVACKILEFLNHSILSVSVCFLCAIALDRYHAVCKPLRYVHTANARLKVVIWVCFSLGIIGSSPILVFYGERTVLVSGYKDGTMNGTTCYYSDVYDGGVGQFAYSSVTLTVFCLCIGAMSILYGKVALVFARGRRRVGIATVACVPASIPGTSSDQVKLWMEEVAPKCNPNIEKEVTNAPQGVFIVGLRQKIQGQKTDLVEIENDTIRHFMPKNGDRDQAVPSGSKETTIKSQLPSQGERILVGSSRATKKITRPQRKPLSAPREGRPGENELQVWIGRKAMGSDQRMKSTRVLFLVTIVFLCSWAPFWILRISQSINPNFWPNNSVVDRVIRYWLYHLIYINNAANPFIYAFISGDFRYKCRGILQKASCFQRKS